MNDEQKEIAQLKAVTAIALGGAVVLGMVGFLVAVWLGWLS